MKKKGKSKFEELLDLYLKGEISVDDYVWQFKVLDAERTCLNTEGQMSKVDPRLVALYEKMRVRLENLAGLKLWGVFDSFAKEKEKGCEVEQWYIKLRFAHNFHIDLLAGSGGSGNSNGKEYWYVSNPDEFNIVVHAPSCGYLKASAPLDEVTAEEVILCILDDFYESEGISYFKRNSERSDKELWEVMSEHFKY